MEDIVHLGETSQCPSSQRRLEADNDYGSYCADVRIPAFSMPSDTRDSLHGVGGSNSARSSSAPSQSQANASHKVRGPNWTEAEMLVLIAQKCVEWDGRHNCNQPSLAKFVYGTTAWKLVLAQKCVEWDGRHNCNQPSLAKFVYGTTAWKLVLAGCMSVVGFRARDTDQITNKWDGLIKEYKKLKEYIDGTDSANWWGLSREEKKQLSKTRKMPLEFSECMYIEMEGFVGKRQIFGRATDVVDSDRVSPQVARRVSRSAPASRAQCLSGA
jgi:hypothetical protein